MPVLMAAFLSAGWAQEQQTSCVLMGRVPGSTNRPASCVLMRGALTHPTVHLTLQNITKARPKLWVGRTAGATAPGLHGACTDIHC